MNMGPETQHETGIAGRYATAIFELAQDTNSIPAVEQDFAALKQLIAENPDFARVVRSPVFGAEDQAKAMKAVLERIGASKLGIQFVLLLASKRRLFYLGDIIAAFTRILATRRGEVHAEVTSARTLSDAELNDLKAALKSKLGRDPRLETKVDPTLLGGLVVKVGSRMIDSSLRTKLDGLRAAMRGH
ncbi:MAG TPA: F0F1 ATP synthase subunit delta [Rhizomicrobium sp.]|jgi:F-type H+-transporting ATPase subunit delta|nr:F0F1 ATP synthase subunit delta [Rhizomicrobium sp.]